MQLFSEQVAQKKLESVAKRCSENQESNIYDALYFWIEADNAERIEGELYTATNKLFCKFL